MNPTNKDLVFLPLGGITEDIGGNTNVLWSRQSLACGVMAIVVLFILVVATAHPWIFTGWL